MEVRMGMGVWQVINSRGEAFPAESPMLQSRDRKKVFPGLSWSGAGPCMGQADRGQVPPRLPRSTVGSSPGTGRSCDPIRS